MDEGFEVPPPFTSYDGLFDMNEAPAAFAPSYGGLKAAVASQNGQRIVLGIDAAQGSTESAIYEGLTGSTRIFSSSFKVASVQRSNYDIVSTAWLYLHPASSTGGGVPFVDLVIAGTAAGYSGQQSYRVVASGNEGADFQGRVLSLVPAGLDAQGRQQFAVVWHQSGRVFRLVYTLGLDPGVFPTNPPQLIFPAITTAVSSAEQVAKGVTQMYGAANSVNYLSSAKLQAAATRDAGLWAIKGWLNFKSW